MPALQNQVMTLLFYSAIHCAKMDTFKELLHHAYEVREDTKLKKVAIEEVARCISLWKPLTSGREIGLKVLCGI